MASGVRHAPGVVLMPEHVIEDNGTEVGAVAAHIGAPASPCHQGASAANVPWSWRGTRHGSTIGAIVGPGADHSASPGIIDAI